MVHGDFSDAFQPATFRLRQANERMVSRCLTNKYTALLEYYDGR